MSSVEQQRHEEWSGEERRAAPPVTHGPVDFAMLGFAAVLALAELAWLGFLGYAAVRALS